MSNVIDTQTKTLINEVVSFSPTTTIDDDGQLKLAATLLTTVKTHTKELTAKKKAIVGPLNASLKEIKALFKPAEDHLVAIEKSIKDAMLTYHNQKEAAARKEAERIARRIDKGTMKVETGIAKLAGIDQADNNIQTEGGSAQFRQGPEKVRVVNSPILVAARPSLLYRERVIEALRMEVLADIKAGVPVPDGVEVYREKVVAGISA